MAENKRRERSLKRNVKREACRNVVEIPTERSGCRENPPAGGECSGDPYRGKNGQPLLMADIEY